jgi:uncharacterized coiled-coil protein SlyX
MADQIDPRGGEIEVSPEEERFLKRFFRRQALPWFALAVLIAVSSAWTLRDGGDDGAREARIAAAVAQLRSESDQLKEQLVALSERMESGLSDRDGGADELERRVEDARRSVRAIESRVTAALERRLDALESQVASEAAAPRGAPLSAGQPPPDAAAWDLSTILDRLYALEMRQEEVSGVLESEVHSRGARLARLEERIAQLERGAAGLPAASAPH